MTVVNIPRGSKLRETWFRLTHSFRGFQLHIFEIEASIQHDGKGAWEDNN